MDFTHDARPPDVPLRAQTAPDSRNRIERGSSQSVPKFSDFFGGTNQPFYAINLQASITMMIQTIMFSVKNPFRI